MRPRAAPADAPYPVGPPSGSAGAQSIGSAPSRPAGITVELYVEKRWAEQKTWTFELPADQKTSRFSVRYAPRKVGRYRASMWMLLEWSGAGTLARLMQAAELRAGRR